MSETVSTKGLDPLLFDTPTFKFGSSTYHLRKLGISDGFKMLQMLNQIWTRGVSEGTYRLAGIAPLLTNPDEFIMGLAPVLGVPACEDVITDWIVSMLEEIPQEGDPVPITHAEFKDPSKFGMGALLVIMAQWARHPDVTNFFIQIEELKDPAVLALVATIKKVMAPKDKPAENSPTPTQN